MKEDLVCDRYFRCSEMKKWAKVFVKEERMIYFHDRNLSKEENPCKVKSFIFCPWCGQKIYRRR